jgi:exopolysaccharide production protein ExoQ
MLQKNYTQFFGLLLTFILFFLSNASAFFYAVWLTPEIVFIESIIWLILAILAAWILTRQRLTSIFFENLKMNWIILPFLVFSGLSIFWSVYWEISLYRWLILSCTIITGGYIGLRYDMKKIIKLLSVFGVYILFLSVLTVFFAPRVGVMNYYIIQGAWKGLYWHKNHMGLIATFANILFFINLIYSLQSREKNKLFWGILYSFSLLFMYQTDSVAAYITALALHGLILLSLVWLKLRKKIRKSHYTIFAVALLFGAVLLYFNLDKFFGVFNRNTTLTGRTLMWSHLVGDYFGKRPFDGYGFNAFWYIDDHRDILGQVAGYPDPVIIADNGFIDILINTGYGGLILFLLFYFGMWWRSISYAGKARDINGMFPLVLMSYTLLANISWSLIFENESFFMLVMITVLFCISAESSTIRGRN